MTRARAVILAILAVALAAGALLWWTQTRLGYHEVLAMDSSYVTLAQPDGTAPLQPFSDHRAIDSDSSPIRFRACLTLLTEGPELDGAVPYPDPEPPVAPGWFGCFDARAIGAALEAGEARAFLSVPDVEYGIDRVIAVFPDRRAFMWHQINRCGAAVYSGDPPPAGCPPPPAGLRLDFAPS